MLAFPSILGYCPCDGIASHIWEDLPCLGSLPICGESPHIRGDSPFIGNLTIYEYSPWTWGTPVYWAAPVHWSAPLGYPVYCGIVLAMQCVWMLFAGGAHVIDMGTNVNNTSTRCKLFDVANYCRRDAHGIKQMMSNTCL
jgi:hypothetical protein